MTFLGISSPKIIYLVILLVNLCKDSYVNFLSEEENKRVKSRISRER